MRLSYPIFETPIVFKENEINVVVIENQQAFSDFVFALVNKSEGAEETDVTIFKDFEEIRFDKIADVSTDITSIDCNNKKVISKLYSKLNEIAFQEENYTLTLDIISEISEYLLTITQTLPCGISFDENVELSTLFKSVSLKVDTDNKNVLEKICDYIEMMSEFCKTELFIFVNLKSYLSKVELEELYKFIGYKKVAILLVENVCREEIVGEIAKVIDEDLCEIS